MPYLALDTETTGLGYWDEAFMVSWARRHNGEIASGVAYVPEWDFDSDEQELVFHNAKFDVQKLVMCGFLTELDWTQIHDTEALSHLVNEQQPKALKRLAKDILSLETDEQEELKKVRRKLKLKKSDGFDQLPPDVLEPYARADAEFTLQLFEYFWPIVSNDPDLLRLYQEEQELMGVLYDVEAEGLGVDMEYVDATAKALAENILRLDLLCRDLTGSEEFNTGSWQQIQAALQERGHNPPDTKKETLAAIDDELAQAILELRHDTKQYGTYFKNIQAETRDGILHPNFKQWGTRGRRFSSGGTEES